MIPDLRIAGLHAVPRPSIDRRDLRHRFIRLALVLSVLALPVLTARAQNVEGIDPSGVWTNAEGSLSLMLTGDALSFSFAAVFGANAHICSGAGVAGLEQANTYHYVDESGIVAFDITRDSIRMRLVEGAPSFCGAGWPGVLFTRTGFTPARGARVRSRKARFFVVMPSPPWERKGYVVKGDRVEYVPTQHEDASDYLLARYRGSRATTVGLLLKKDLLLPK